MDVFNRYERLKKDGKFLNIPFIPIINSPSDKTIEFKLGVTRFDKLSYFHYGSPFFDWVIKQANPEYTLEFDIEDGAYIRIPLPIENAISNYLDEVEKYHKI